MSYWLYRGQSQVQVGNGLPLANGLFLDELRLTEGPGVYRLVVNADAGGTTLSRVVYVIARGGAFAERRVTGAASPQARIAWTDDPRLTLTGPYAGSKVYVRKLTEPTEALAVYDLSLPGAAATTTLGLNLAAGDGVYRLTYDPVPGSTATRSDTTVVLDQPSDPWTPVTVPAGQSLPVTAGAAYSTTRQLTLTGTSANEKVGLFVYNAAGTRLQYVTASRSADGSFSGGVYLNGANDDTYLISIADGPAGAQTLTVRWSVVVKVGSGGAGVGAGATTSGTSAATLLQGADQAAAAEDDFWAGRCRLDALTVASAQGDKEVLDAAAGAVLSTISATRNYLLADAAGQTLKPVAGSAADILVGQAFAQASRRREALKEFQRITAVEPANAAAAAGLGLVSDPGYTWTDGGDRPAVRVAGLTDINTWAKALIERMNFKGVIKGFADRTFRPDLQIRRDEAVTMVDRVLGLEAEAKSRANDQLPYSDASSIAAWARGYLVYALRNGIITGYNDNTVRPNDPVRRSEMAALAGRVDDRTRTAIDDMELEGLLTRVDPGDPGVLHLRLDAPVEGAAGSSPASADTVLTMALNPSIYGHSRSLGLLELKPGSRVRVITGDAGTVGYIEVLGP